MAEPRTIDIANLPELRRLVEDARATDQPRILRAGDEDVALLMPLRSEDISASEERADDEVFLSSLGGWSGLVDAEQLKATLREARGPDRPPVELER